MNDLLIGLLSGVVLASGTFTLRSWQRRHRLKQPWLPQTAKAEQLKTEQLLQENQELSYQLARNQDCIEALERELGERQQQLDAAQAQCQQLTRERDKAWQEAEQILDLDQAEAEQQQAQLKALAEQVQQLKQDLASANGQLAAQTHSLEEAQTRLQTGTIGAEQFAQAIARLLPNVTFLRDSTETILQEPPHRLNALLGSLRALSDGSLTQNHKRNGIKVVKVHATDGKWSEFHVPNASMMRVYFHKSKQGNDYQVLVTEKKDPKTQGKNHAWLKSQSVS